MKLKQGLKCMYFNADQLLNKMEDLRLIVDNDAPDIIMITEVIPKAQINPIQEPIMTIKGYQIFTNFKFTEECLGVSGRRGVAIYISEKIDVELVRLKTYYHDHLWLKLKLRNNDSLLVGCIYRSPHKDISKVIETTRTVCDVITEGISLKITHTLICGDFNYPEIDWENEFVHSETVKTFIEKIQSCDLHQHVCKPTRYRDGQEPSLLDLVLTTEEGIVQNLVHDPGLGDSDHECLRFEVKCYQEEYDETPVPNYDKADYENIRSKLDNIDWVTLLRGNFNEAYEKFISALDLSMEGNIPNKLKGKKKKNMYLSIEAIRMKDKKNTLWRRYKKSGKHYDLFRYRRVKNQLRSLTRRLRINFENDIARNLKTAPKKYWAYVKSRTKLRSKIPILSGQDESTATTPLEKANTLNDFFSSVFTEEHLESLPQATTEFTGKYLRNFVIDESDVYEKLMKLNPGKTPGPDKWHPRFLKNIADLISHPLSILFQKSLNEGILPSDWLKACITAIYKKGEKSKPGNYRPVSMTSIICKLMESIVRDKLVEHMVENDLFSDCQHGFVLLRDCMTNLLTCMEIWCEFLEKGESVDVIYTDFAKAFDSVPHERLLTKLEGLGVTGNVLAWIRSFLSNRSQCVRVDNEFSNWKPVKSGIPQGSVLGPILFVIFINDMPEVVKNLCKLFADDAKLFCSVHLRDETNNKSLQEDINALMEWSNKWQLPFNIGKCKCLHIGCCNPCWRYKMDGKFLDDIVEEKDLGVLIDKDLKFHRQTASAVKKANSALGLVKKTFANLDDKNFPLLYKSLVRPHLEYGNVIWGPFYKGDEEQVERVQRRATKAVGRLSTQPYKDRLRQLNLPSLQHRRRRGDMIMTYKILTGKVNLEKEAFFTLSSNQTNRGSHPLKLAKKKASKETSLNKFSTRVVNDWNSLPTHVVMAQTTNDFKSKLDEHWKLEQFETPF